MVLRELGKEGLHASAVDCDKGAPAFASGWCTAAEVLPDFAQRQDKTRSLDTAPTSVSVVGGRYAITKLV